jgi:APA family basic amino acid/polyamine antiporter
MVPYDLIDVRAPVSEAFRAAGMPWMQMLVAIAAVAGMTSVLLVVVMSLPRVLMAVGRDGLLPESFFGAVDPKTHTPGKSVLFVGLVAMVVASFVPLRFLMDTVMMATLAGYVSVCLFTLALRRLPGASEPAFRAPLGPVVPVFGVGVCLLLMFSLPPVNWAYLGCWWAIGMAVYALYGFRRGSVVDRTVAVVAESVVTKT